MFWISGCFGLRKEYYPSTEAEKFIFGGEVVLGCVVIHYSINNWLWTLELRNNVSDGFIKFTISLEV